MIPTRMERKEISILKTTQNYYVWKKVNWIERWSSSQSYSEVSLLIARKTRMDRVQDRIRDLFTIFTGCVAVTSMVRSVDRLWIQVYNERVLPPFFSLYLPQSYRSFERSALNRPQGPGDLFGRLRYKQSDTWWSMQSSCRDETSRKPKSFWHSQRVPDSTVYLRMSCRVSHVQGLGKLAATEVYSSREINCDVCRIYFTD